MFTHNRGTKNSSSQDFPLFVDLVARPLDSSSSEALLFIPIPIPLQFFLLACKFLGVLPFVEVDVAGSPFSNLSTSSIDILGVLEVFEFLFFPSRISAPTNGIGHFSWSRLIKPPPCSLLSFCFLKFFC